MCVYIYMTVKKMITVFHNIVNRYLTKKMRRKEIRKEIRKDANYLYGKIIDKTS